jgi:serpin B
LPRFKTEKSFTLNEPLKALGMRAAFEKADFSGMHTGGEQLDITAVIHKAFVDVNEEGTEAAGATGVVVGLTSAAPPPAPKYFRADRPFLFLIRDHKTGSVLFLGRVENPRA